MIPQNHTQRKDAKNESEHEELTVTVDQFFRETIYFNMFECGKNLLNKLDAMFEQACMATPRDKYYTELFRTITYFNNHNNAPFSNEHI